MAFRAHERFLEETVKLTMTLTLDGEMCPHEATLRADIAVRADKEPLVRLTCRVCGASVTLPVESVQVLEKTRRKP